jgi:molybdopterin synthase catalytic subunit
VDKDRKRRNKVEEQIQVRVRAFASLRQVLGMASLTLSLSPGTTVAGLMERLSGDYPAAAPHLARALVAVNQDYADRTQPLAADDEVAVFPPVSGGAQPRTAHTKEVTHIAVSAEPIDPLQLSALVTEPSIGAVVTFAGVVRDNNLGRQVGYLEYEAYPEMAETKMQQVVAEARERWPAIRGVAVVHRTGHLEIGEMAVLVAVGAPHRGDGAFEAARYIIDRTKEIVPIWKKESWADGEEWLEGDYRPQPGE